MALNWEYTAWPPKPDDDRIADYNQFERLFEGDHAKAFENFGAFVGLSRSDRRKRITYLTANYAGLISKLAADLLFSEHPTFLAEDEAAQENIDDLVDRNDLWTTLYEAALSASFRGDAVFRVRKGRRHPSDEKEDVIIEEVPASSYFVEHSPDNLRHVLSESIAWVHRVPGSKRTFLRVEEHTPGKIRNLAFELHESTGKVGAKVPLKKVYGSGPDVVVPPDEEATGIERSLLVHVPNFRHGSRFWGLSDYYDLWTLFDAVNNRLSRTEKILDRHSSPKLVLPAGATDESGTVRLSEMDLFEVANASEASVVRYVTWDAKLEAAFTHLEHLIDQIFRLAEVSPAAFGLDKAGSIESGRAMRMRFVRTAAKIARKRQYFEIGIRWVLWLAQEMRRVHFGVTAPVVEPAIHWQDGIPDDDVEIAEVEQTRVTAGLTSKRSAMQRMFRMTKPQAQAEMKQIAREAAGISDDEDGAEQDDPQQIQDPPTQAAA